MTVRFPKTQGLRSATIWLITPLLICGLGCPPPAKVIPALPPGPPRELSEIVTAIEKNAARLDAAVWSNSVQVTARFTDEDGKEHVYNLDSNLLYRPPQSLRMDLRPAIGEQVMQIGSNAKDYWIWIDPEIGRMWWGRHRNIGKPCTKDVIARPDDLVAALGMAGLPKAADGLVGPARKYGHQYDILYYMRRRSSGDYSLEREYWVSRSPPYQVIGVKIRDRLGRVVTSALLDDYHAAWENGPLIPHAINIIWPRHGGKFTMWLGSSRKVTTLGDKTFERPSPDRLPPGVRDHVIQVDVECD